MKLSAIAKRSKRLTLKIELEPGVSDDLRFDYRPSAYTADLLKQMSVSKAEDESDESYIQRSLDDQPSILAQLISWWDATDDEGQTLQPTEEVFAALDIPFRSSLLQAISKDINPDPPKPTPSSGGSFTTVG